ncbi:MAG: hypothetical protein JWN04_2919 [Myxococcaceae bacterium]|nr:hypothetical protein [Myxococcaceae bacterium]
MKSKGMAMFGRDAALQAGSPAGRANVLSPGGVELFALVFNMSVMLFAGQLSYGLVGFTLRYTSALGAVAVIARALGSGSGPQFWRAASLYAPFAAAGLCATAFSNDLGGSLSGLIRWSLMLGMALALGTRYGAGPTYRIISRTLLLALVLSIATAVLLPQIGNDVYGDRPVWRGLFPHKNTLGRTALIGILLAVCGGTHDDRRLTFVLFCVSLVALIGSNNVGSIAVGIACCAFLYCLRAMHRTRLSGGLIVFAEASFLLISVTLFLVYGEMVLSWFGRDLSFTGRTAVWDAYYKEAISHWMLGQGPGSLSSASPITNRLRNDNFFDGQAIATPHNTYLAVLGDAGVFGLIAYVGMLVYVMTVRGAQQRTEWARTAATFALATMLGGFVETLEVYSEGIGLLVSAWIWGLTSNEWRQARTGDPLEGEWADRE